MVRGNIAFDDEVWRAFRIACLQHNTTPSTEIREFVQERLEEWNVAHPYKITCVEDTEVQA